LIPKTGEHLLRLQKVLPSETQRFGIGYDKSPLERQKKAHSEVQPSYALVRTLNPLGSEIQQRGAPAVGNGYRSA
jgi:hypothetical protein